MFKLCITLFFSFFFLLANFTFLLLKTPCSCFLRVASLILQ